MFSHVKCWYIKDRFLLPTAFCPSPCSRRMDMCTGGCICTWPGAWRSQTGIASLSRCPTRPSPSLWCGFWFFPMSQPRVSNFLSDSPTAKLISSGVRFTCNSFYHSPFQNNGGISSELPWLARAPIHWQCSDSLCTWTLTKWQMFPWMLNPDLEHS